MNQTQGSKHCFHYGRERFGEFSRSHSGLRCLLLASQDNVNKFIAIRRRSCDLADFERRQISCLVYMYIFTSYRNRSVVHSWICLTKKKFVHLKCLYIWWTLLPTKEGEREQTARWEIVSPNNLIFIDKFILFWKQCPFEILMRK